MITVENISQLLAQGSPWVFLVVFAAGVATSLSPCLLAMAPVIMGYVGAQNSRSPGRSLALSLSMVLGLATAFSILGFIAVIFGRVFGYTGRYWPLVLGVLFVVIGLNYLKLININWPGIKRMPVNSGGLSGAYLVGLVFGVAASPCATGVLAAILGFASMGGSFYMGGLMLFIYGLGHGIPLVVLGTLAGSARRMDFFSRYWDYFSFVLGLLFAGVGVYLIAMAL
jgi:cytochrome c-type biogenesis protein